MSHSNASTVSYLIHFQTHPIVDLVVAKCYVILVDRIPFLQCDLLVICTSLGSDKFLEVAYCILWTTLDAHFAAQTIVGNDFDERHVGRNITEYKWDGTDMYGAKLANGVYLYRVLTNLNGKSLEKYKADGDDTDKYFNKGYGKMVIIR